MTGNELSVEPRQMSAAASTDRSRRALGAALLVVALAVLPYLNSLSNGFAFDDPDVVRDNPMVTHDPPAALFTAVYNPGAIYRPLTMLTYVANHRVDAAPFGFHLVNVALHALVTLAVFLLVRRLLDSLLAATVAAALFAVHPVHTEAVSNVVGRAELLAALLVVTTLLATLRARAARGAAAWAWQVTALLAFAAGMLAKESVFTAIGLVAVVVWWTDPARSVTGAMRAIAPFVTLGAAYLALRLVVVGSLGLPTPPPLIDNPLAHVGAARRVATAMVVLLDYGSLLMLPLHLAPDYSYNAVPMVASPLDGRFLLAALVAVATLALAALLGRRVPVLLVAAAFIAVPLAVTANVLFPIGTIKAERLLYLPSIGWCLAVGWLAAAAARTHRRAALAAVAALVLAFAARTWARNPDWNDNFSLFTAAVQSEPHSAKAHYNLGIAYDVRGDSDTAMVYLRRALRIHPDCAEAAFAIGSIYERKGLDAGALHWYAQAIARNWNYPRAHLTIGALRYQRGEYDAAEAAFRTGLEQDPDNPRLLFGLGLALQASGKRDEAQLVLAGIDADRVTDQSMRDALMAAALTAAVPAATGTRG